MIEVNLACDVIVLFWDVLLYQMNVKYAKFLLLRQNAMAQGHILPKYGQN